MKVDCQAGVGMMGSRCGGGPLLAASFHSALEESIARHFPGNHCINCMAHSTENIYRCHCPPSSGTTTIRLTPTLMSVRILCSQVDTFMLGAVSSAPCT